MAVAIRTGRQHRANGEMANHVLELMHAFHTSAESGKYEQLATSCQRPDPLPLGLLPGQVEVE